ncbi:MAG: hypothetical protein IT206_02165 [Fimbriimonadaceae bacterium]|nr:hypothetical protein [Fimbriimonadaceae bacterium]
MDELIELLRPMLGDKAEEIARALVNHVRGSDGGVKGFFDRVRSAGFSDNLERWLRDEPTQVSDTLVANLFGAGALDQLAERFGLTIESVTQAATVALPQLARHLDPESTPKQELVHESALNTTQRPSIGWGLVAVLVTALAIWASLGFGVSQAKNPSEQRPVLKVHQTGEESAESSLSIEHKGVGVVYYCRVPKAQLTQFQGVLDRVLGEKASGALIGVDAEDPQLIGHFEEIVQLMNNSHNVLKISTVQGTIVIEGEAGDLPQFRRQLATMSKRTGLPMDWTHVGQLKDR